MIARDCNFKRQALHEIWSCLCYKLPGFRYSSGQFGWKTYFFRNNSLCMFFVISFILKQNLTTKSVIEDHFEVNFQIIVFQLITLFLRHRASAEAVMMMSEMELLNRIPALDGSKLPTQFLQQQLNAALGSIYQANTSSISHGESN